MNSCSASATLRYYNETLKDLLAPLPPLSGAGASLQTTDRPASPIKGGSSMLRAAQSSTLRIIEDQKQSRVIITGLREEIVTDADTVLDLIQRGQDERHVGATDWNERSSRSHCVFQLTIESRARQTASAGKSAHQPAQPHRPCRLGACSQPGRAPQRRRLHQQVPPHPRYCDWQAHRAYRHRRRAHPLPRLEAHAHPPDVARATRASP